MRLKRNKLLLGLSALSTLSLVTMAAACGQKTKTEGKAQYYNRWSRVLDSNNLFDYNRELTLKEDVEGIKDTYAKELTYSSYLASPYSGLNSFQKDHSISYGGIHSTMDDCLLGSLFRKQSLFSPIVTNTLGKYHVFRPSVWKNKLEIAGKIVLTLNDGTVKEYDNDEIDVYPSPTDKVATLSVNGQEKTYKTFEKDLYKGLSTNAKSINNEQFEKDLENTKKLQIVLKDGLKWVDTNGQKTKYDIVPEDFYISWLRTVSLSTNIRHKMAKEAGYSADEIKSLDENIRKTISANSRYFTEGMYYPNEYLFNLMGINSDNFYKKDKMIQEYQGKKAITFEAKENEKSFFKDFFENLMSSYEFMPAPSQYIAEKSKENHVAKPVTKDSNSDKAVSELKKLFTKVTDKNKQLFEAGIYWYGVHDDELLFAGPYYIKGANSFNPDTNIYTYYVNKHHVSYNPKVDDKHKIQKIQYRYMGQTDANQFKTQHFSDFINGRASNIPESSLSENNANKAFNDPTRFGLYYAGVYNKTNLKHNFLNRLTPGDIEFNKDTKLLYNDNYAKLLYGLSTQEIKLGQTSSEKSMQHVLFGKGLAFRTLLGAAVNWEYAAEVATKGRARAWYNMLPEDGTIGGSDKETSKYKTSRDAIEKLSEIFAIDKDGNKVKFGENKTDINTDDNEKSKKNEAQDKEKIKSAGYKQIQKALKELLDEFYKENKLDASKDKISWRIPYRWLNWSPVTMQNVFEMITKMVNELDPRLEVEIEKITDGKQFKSRLVDPVHSFEMSGWGNDFDSIGASFDGISAGGTRVLLLAMGAKQEWLDKVKVNFPKLATAAKAFYDYMQKLVTDGKFDAKVPFDKLINIPISQFNLLTSGYQNYEFDNATNRLKELESPNKKGDLGLSSARFWNEYVKNITNEDLIELAKEYSNFLGIPLATEEKRYAQKDPFARTFVSPYLLRPSVGEHVLYIEDIIVPNYPETSNQQETK